MRGRAIRAVLAVMVGALLAAGCAPGGPRSAGDRSGLSARERERFWSADPSAVIATELAFARTAQEKGQWSAFAEFADDDAVMFVPQPVKAKDWLKGRQNPAEAVRWQPHEVWSSCDGTLAVTKGAWQRPDGTVGYFTTVWERQRGGQYKWVMDQGDVLAQPLEAPEFVDAQTAVCSPMPDPAAARAGIATDDRRSGWSKDATLLYATDVRPDGGRTVVVRRWNGATYEEVVRSEVSAG
jgi:hypothetical protein